MDTKVRLARAHRHLNGIVTPVLYRDNVRYEDSNAMFCAAKHGCIDTLKRLVASGAELNDNSTPRNSLPGVGTYLGRYLPRLEC